MEHLRSIGNIPSDSRGFTNAQEKRRSVGIEKMIITTPGLHIDAAEMAKVVGMPEGKIRTGIGINKIRMCGYSESNLTFIADAMYIFLRKVASSDIEYGKFLNENPGKIFLGTESSPEKSRPELMEAMDMACSKLAMDAKAGKVDGERVRNIMIILKNASVTEEKFACAGGMLALGNAMDYVSNRSNKSALVFAADTAVYDFPEAEITQGAASSLLWVKRDPQLMEYEGNSASYNINLPDFTKFGRETPVVCGNFSTITFVFVVSQAHKNFELENTGLKCDYIITHTPFPKQVKYFAATFLIHELKEKNPELLKSIEDRIGENPLKRGRFTKHFEDLLEKFSESEETDIVKFIEQDRELMAYWEWAKKKFAETEEFKAFKDVMRLDDALILPSEIGNSYTVSIFVKWVSLLLNAKEDVEGKSIRSHSYGSGAISEVQQYRVLRVLENDNVIVKLDDSYPIGADVYKELHSAHIEGDAKRTMTEESLVEKDKKLLGTERLSEGFHIVRRFKDGRGDYVFVENGVEYPIKMVYTISAKTFAPS